MKVIHLISGGDTGGAKTHVHSLLQGLIQHITAHMICFTDGPFVEEARALGIPTEVIAGGNPLTTHRALTQRITQEGYDLIHCHGARANLAGALLRRSTGLPVITTVHSDPKLDYMGRPLANLTLGTLNNWALHQIPYHIGVSDAMVDLLITRGFDPHRLFALYNGIDFRPRTPKLTRSAYLASLGLDWPEEAVIVGIAARLNPVKDIATLIRGFAAAHAQQPQLRLIIAGEGEEQEMLVQLAQQLGVAQEICFAGWVSDTDSFYHALDINALTSLSETFPYALTEGARCALPTVATRVGGVPYLIEHGVTGLLLEPKDDKALAQHLARLAGDPQLRRQLGEQLLEKGRTQFSLERTIQRQLEIYQTVLRRAHLHSTRSGVLVCGAYGKDNAGDEAILQAILTEVRTADPDRPIWVMTRKPKQTRLLHRVNALYTFHLPAFLRRAAQCEVYLNGGGSLLQDVTSRRSLWFYLFTLSAAKRLGCKVMVYGCGMGPIRSARNRKRTARVLNRWVDCMTLRDQTSVDQAHDMGVTCPITLSADPTVSLPAPSPAIAAALLEQAGLHPLQGERYLGISLRPWPGFEDKVSILASVVEAFCVEHQLIPVFLPTEGRLDIPASQLVAQQLRRTRGVLMAQPLSTPQILALFGRMDVVLSMRLHPLVFSACSGVPLVGIVYDPKVKAFLDSIQQDLYTTLDALTAQNLRRHLDTALARSQDHAYLSEQTRRLTELEAHNLSVLKTLLPPL
ncbi:MAG TPA: polysaccharide pyruvyl transferase CsaB [Clostridiales bacterium]|nr:polysaccharide pyruvyl transferase CsaB [Clostridiales bacterium]